MQPNAERPWFLRVYIGIRKERQYLIENLSMLIAGGMVVTDAIDAIAAEIRSKSMKDVLRTLREDIENGLPLWRAFSRAGIFREYTISLVRLGEESGNLSHNLALIAEQEEKDRLLRSKIRSAMLYPLFVLTLTVTVGVAIAWFILPRLATVFAQLRVELPYLTQKLITFGNFLEVHGSVVLPLVLSAFFVLMYFVFFFPKTKFIGQTILFRIPGVKLLLQEVEIARFGYMLGTLLRAGLPVTQALHSLKSASLFPHYQKLYAHLERSVTEGNSFSKSFATYRNARRLIPTPIQQLVVAGEQSGNLADTLLRISTTFEERTENTSKNLTVILEPVLLVIVWLGVVAVALAVILPIYSLIGGFNAGESPTEAQQNVVEEIEARPVLEDPVLGEEEAVIPVATTTTATSPLSRIEILTTDIGYLNVRSAASTEGVIVATVLPGERYVYRGKENGWYYISVSGEVEGWVYGAYVTDISTDE
ncbi:type II secretion system F family protein [Candidatus Kaiserbacteria bacterium]|nr:type II secretion system F family protein [Candidatus Kaiserbacteria bacterium]